MGILPLNTMHKENGLHSSTYFAYLKNLSNKVQLNDLSMGMSQDYTEAVKFGATFVRIGSAVFKKDSND